MALDGLLIAGINSALQEMKGCKISRIQSLSEEEVLISAHKKGFAAKLVINTHSNTNRIYLAKEARDFLQTPTNFVMLLRKYISQGIITGISQIGFDRILKFAILGHNELGDPIEYDLYAELMGKYANLVLVDHHSSTIIDCLKRIPVFENSKRLLHPGAKYTLPAPQQKMSPLSVDGVDLESSLVKQVEG
ncbi:NFACT family protein, partial [Ileibacterium valens]